MGGRSRGAGWRKERRKWGGQDPGRTTLSSQALNARQLLGERNTQTEQQENDELNPTK